MQKIPTSLLIAALLGVTASVVLGNYFYSWLNKPKIQPPPTTAL